MSQPYQPPNFQPVPSTPQNWSNAAPQRKSGLLGKVVVGIIALVVGIALGAAVASSGGDNTTATPAPTVTVTRTAPPPAGEPTTEPSSTEPAPPAKFQARPKDFTVGIKILKKQCFGDVGCNVSYRINPHYIGSQPLPDTGTIEVTYRVTGDESGPTDNTFTIEGGTASYDKEEMASTPSSHTKLKAKVLSASYSD